ncbi:50S ribosomal protein L35 [candidate division CPR3 bacterium GWF2_35_18]|uniref:Large ribosomal subunit protein bL35 n=1 Tax=candidate division CPR3 bacterium GW2011_GWF2_35_18 TaxID=1618350 RepID=A0A0G0BKL3_UNCC3|nr:MAG: 50S ribosomal protein L35 [candidate division CPR3 bacterium GW2011_GWF2_35_18]KKP85956.1 MAG: 50S ribosomal protein L35 [candidate division CPR3 bacterium GW2011_GWE2_35_7]OGB62791.1 MAG: 50S ribosomal protein L35 [candidate division CPR3 bacterium GWF2_35_18]OGB65372.1 MAG: 50S ribosomal protein L35 [candidate division CPR3 bacterium RIFOXYA2_FULL_35_13]OGB76261.1 MAG: 50S ribosomal protein L35 [candidate division CPR3 bacterium RIFOXYC2_FULL_35_7]OGB78270.1 MAG: 50S ribosomal protei
MSKAKVKKLKLKTKKIISKRVKVTGSGKFKRQHVATSHLKEKQSSRTRRRKSKDEITSPSDTKRIKKLLPYS